MNNISSIFSDSVGNVYLTVTSSVTQCVRPLCPSPGFVCFLRSESGLETKADVECLILPSLRTHHHIWADLYNLLSFWYRISLWCLSGLELNVDQPSLKTQILLSQFSRNAGLKDLCQCTRLMLCEGPDPGFHECQTSSPITVPDFPGNMSVIWQTIFG